MSRIVIEPTRKGVLARVTLVEISLMDGIYGLSCSGDDHARTTGDPVHECPSAGFDPGDRDTWTDREACLEAGEIHLAMHERRFCWLCDGRMSAPVDDTDENGRIERRTCVSCGTVEERS